MRAELHLPALRTLLVALALVLVPDLLAPPSAVAALHAPFTLDPARTLSEQWGYRPEYTQNIPVFDPWNRPYIRSRWASQDDTSFVHALEQGDWVKHDFIAALVAAYPDLAGTVLAGGWATDRLVFDEAGRAYQVLTIRLEEGDLVNVLLYSLDGCVSWGVAELPFGNCVPRYDFRMWGNVAMEHAAGGGRLRGPPFLMFWKQVAPWKGVWASRHELYVVQPRLEGETLVVPAPRLVTKRALAPVQCAGGSSFAATAADATYFVYTRVASLTATTTPTYVARYDQRTGSVSSSVLVGGAKPANDSHNTPGLCIDSRGVLHVVMGSHGYAFQYAHSLRPYDISAWTKKRPVSTSGLRVKGTDRDGRACQTYVSLACDPRDTLHLVFRESRRGVDAYLDGRRYGALSYQRKPAGKGWTKSKVLVRGPSVYGQFYQKLSVDRLGRLFVSGSYWTAKDYDSTRAYRRFHHRIVLFSPDGGDTWRLASTAHFADGFSEPLPAPEPQPEPTPLPSQSWTR